MGGDFQAIKERLGGIEREFERLHENVRDFVAQQKKMGRFLQGQERILSGKGAR
jgi:hypothetical protein